MKKAFPIYTAISIIIFGWAILFRVQHWPGGNVLALIAFVLTMINAGWAGAFFHKNETFSKAFSIFLGIAVGFIVWGLVFRFLHWPGATPMLVLSLGLMIPASSIWGCISYLKHNK